MLVKVFLSLLGFALKLNELQCFPPLVELTAEQAPLRELFEKHPFLPYNKNGNFTV